MKKTRPDSQPKQVTLSTEQKVVRRLSEELDSLKDTVDKLTEEKNDLIEQAEVKERKIIELEINVKDMKKKLKGNFFDIFENKKICLVCLNYIQSRIKLLGNICS